MANANNASQAHPAHNGNNKEKAAKNAFAHEPAKDAAREAGKNSVEISANKPPLVLVHDFNRVEKAYSRSDLEGIYRLKVGRRKGLDIWIVDGAKIRRELYAGFVYGGHNFVYKFIPLDEVWIDNLISVEELEFTIMHEITEHEAMTRGESYDKAHELANQEELKARINKTESIDDLRDRWYKTHKILDKGNGEKR